MPIVFFGSVMTGGKEMGGMPLYAVSSTRFGSIMMKRSWFGPFRYKREVMSAWMATDFPRTRRAGDQSMRHLRDIDVMRCARDVAAKSGEEGASVLSAHSGAERSPPRPTIAFDRIGHFNADERFPGMGAFSCAPGAQRARAQNCLRGR